MRSKYLRAILRQDVGFFDMAGANVAEVVNRVGADTMVIQDCIGEKVIISLFYQLLHNAHQTTMPICLGIL